MSKVPPRWRWSFRGIMVLGCLVACSVESGLGANSSSQDAATQAGAPSELGGSPPVNLVESEGGQSQAGSSAAEKNGRAGAISSGQQGLGTGGLSGKAGNVGTGATTGGAGPCTPDPDCTPQAPESGDPHADCVARVNQLRACLCVGPLQRYAEAEACADQQAKHDSEHGPGSGFSAGICEPAALAQNECPGVRSESAAIGSCTQQMFAEGPPEQTPCSYPSDCYQGHGRYLTLTSTSYSRLACGFYSTASGPVWMIQSFFR